MEEKDINLIQEIQNIIINNSNEELKSKISKYHPFDIASAVKELDQELKDKLFDSLDSNIAADIIEYLDSEESADILEEMDANKSSEIISKMELDDAVDVINSLEEDVKKEVIKELDDEVKEDIITLSNYGEDEAGSIMTDNFLAVDISFTVAEAMKKLVKESYEQEVIDIIFVVEEEKLVGYIELKDLIIARKNQLIKDIMQVGIKSVDVKTNIIEATNIVKEYNLLALPVTQDDKLIGIITIDDAIDFVDDSASEDYDKMAGIVSNNDKTFFSVIKSRLLWLIILLILSFAVSFVMEGFASIIASVTCLVFFQSFILGMCGNAGTQALATTIVDLSQNELLSKTAIRRHLFKEFVSGLMNSIILGICAFGLAYLFIILRNISGDFTPFTLSLVIGSSMTVSLLITSYVGALIPIVLYKLHIDPAVASGPFIATLNDIVSVSIYYGLAYFILLSGVIK